MFDESQEGMYYTSESQAETTSTRKARTRRMSSIEYSTEQKPTKIYLFAIEKLTEENARYWFHYMEKQLRSQYCWQKDFQTQGPTRYRQILEQNVKWDRVNLKAEMIIEQGLKSTTILEIKGQDNAGLKWEYLRQTFLKTTNARKAMKLMKMANWTWDSSKMNEIEALEEISRLGDEFIDMNDRHE